MDVNLQLRSEILEYSLTLEEAINNLLNYAKPSLHSMII